MRRIFNGTLLILFSITFLMAGDGIWQDSDYEKFTYKSFEKYKPALERIDMQNINYPLLNAAIFYETNRQRDVHKLPVFKHSPALESAAKGHSNDMVKYNFFSHTSPVQDKKTMSMRLARVGITRAAAAENIAYTFGIEYESGRPVYPPDLNGGYFSYQHRGKPIENRSYLGLAQNVVRGWMNSPGHRKNILNSKYLYLGVGAAHYIDGSFYNIDNFKVTQNFASIKGGD